jgi:hypothetical protein
MYFIYLLNEKNGQKVRAEQKYITCLTRNTSWQDFFFISMLYMNSIYAVRTVRSLLFQLSCKFQPENNEVSDTSSGSESSHTHKKPVLYFCFKIIIIISFRFT